MLAWKAWLPAHVSVVDRMVQLLLMSFLLFSVVSISLMQASYILAVVLWVVGLALRDGWRQVALPLIVPVAGFGLASVLCSITGMNPYGSLIELRNVLEVLIFYLAVNQIATQERATILVQGLMAAGTVMALYGLAQSVSHGTIFRVHGTMSIYMTFAGLLMLINLLALAFILYQSQSRQVLWYFGVSLCLTAALIMTQTRSAWVGLLAGGCVLLAARKKVLMLVLPVVLLLVFVMAPGVIQERLRSFADRKDATAQQRLSMWRSGLQIIRDYPVTGIGMGAMATFYQRYREPDADITPTRRLGHLHNNVIQVAAERGLLGLTCWLGIWVAYFYHVWHIARRLPPGNSVAKALVLGSVASVIGFHAEGLFENTFGDSEVVSLTYFCMALPFVVQRGLPVLETV